jgi:hypothetical protein
VKAQVIEFLKNHFRLNQMNSKHLAGLIGPTLVVLTVSEALNAHIWTDNIAPGVYLNGALLFVAGLSVIRSHNLWICQWPTLVTLTGWMAISLGLFRMFAPEIQLKAVTNTSLVIAEAIAVLVLGIFLTVKGYSPDTRGK